MLLKSIFEAVALPDDNNSEPKVVTEEFFEKRIPGIIYRWQSLNELIAIYNGEWELIGFDEYGEEEHDPEYDDMYFKSFSTHENKEQNEMFLNDVLIAYDENGLAKLGGGTKLVDYVYDEKTKENEKRLISPNRMLPIAQLGGKYWKLVKAIYVPKSELDYFKEKFLPQFSGHEQLLPPWYIISDM